MSDKDKLVTNMTEIMSKFVALVGKKLPDDVENKLQDLSKKETSQLAKVIYSTMQENQNLAMKLNRPCCQDTGVLQFSVRCGTNFPLIGELENILTNAVFQATITPLLDTTVLKHLMKKTLAKI